MPAATPARPATDPARQRIGEVLIALGDPTRRRLFERICEEPRAVSVLARGLPISRPAVSQHLRCLENAGLVTATRFGTRRIYRAREDGLAVLRAWLDRYWDTALNRFAQAAEQAERNLRGDSRAASPSSHRTGDLHDD